MRGTMRNKFGNGSRVGHYGKERVEEVELLVLGLEFWAKQKALCGTGLSS